MTHSYRRVLAGCLVFGLSYLMAVFLASAADVLVLGHEDEKWGGPWGNVHIAVYLYGTMLVPGSLAVFLLAQVVVAKWLGSFVAGSAEATFIVLGVVPGLTGSLVLATCLALGRRRQRA